MNPIELADELRERAETMKNTLGHEGPACVRVMHEIADALVNQAKPEERAAWWKKHKAKTEAESLKELNRIRALKNPALPALKELP